MKQKALRIFPFMGCNYNCNYCTAYNTFNKRQINLNRGVMPATYWIKAINDKSIYKVFDEKYRIIISGGEPGLYKDLIALCNGLENRNIYVYTNVSERAYLRLLEMKPVFIYPSFHLEFEKDFRKWFERVYNLKNKGHKIFTPHYVGKKQDVPIPNVKQEDINNSPYVNSCRVNSEQTRKVKCSTQQFVVDSVGNIFNCQAHLWENTHKLGNIREVDWGEFPEWVDCNECGQCHICSQGKVIADMNGEIIKDEWQLKVNQ